MCEDWKAVSGKVFWNFNYNFFCGRLDSKMGQLRYIKNAVISRVSEHPRAENELKNKQ